MTMQHRLPACRQVEAEHLLLEEILASIRDLLAERSAPPATVQETLGELRRRVLQHFQTEEEAGFFKQVVQAAPRLKRRIDALQWEHLEMASQLAEIKLCAGRRPADDSWWAGLQEQFTRFRELFASHEAAENLLLQEAYSDDLGGEE